MAPKPKNKGADKSKENENAPEPLQAIVFTDSFETKFSPFTLQKPRCLLPLANTPLIEYTLEFLAHSGVEQVFIYCGAHTEQVEEYLDKSKWSRSSSPFKLEILRSTSTSIGDAMRDLDARATMSGDFLVVYGDVVSNFPLDAALQDHKARRKLDKNAIMTMILREKGTDHRSDASGSSGVFILDPNKKRCLHYEQMAAGQDRHYVEIDPEILSTHRELEIRHDLIDCGIDICTPDVLALWTDNFDYEAPRKGFLYGVLKDYELNSKTIHTHLVKDFYAARVRNLAMYNAVSRDVISRWAWPICPDNNLQQGQKFRLEKGLVYKEDAVRLAKSCIIGSGTVLGRGTSAGEGTIISGSVIGRNCKIGKNCLIENAYIWDRVTIGDDCVVQHAIVASDAAIGNKSKVQEGALVSYGVKLAPESILGKRKRITTITSNSGQVKSTDVTDRFEVEATDGELEDEEGLTGQIYSMQNLSLSTDSVSTLNSDAESDEPLHHDRSAGNSFVSVASDDSHSSHSASDFLHDATASIYDSLQKGHDSSNIALELSNLRMTTDASEHQVRRAVVSAFTKRIADVMKTGKAAKLAVEEVLTPHKHLIGRTMFDADTTKKPDQVDFLLLLQNSLVNRDDGDSVLLWMVRQMYNDMDLLEEEGIEQWWSDPRSVGREELAKVRAKTQQLVDALAEMESEEDDDDEDEEESD